MRKDLIGAKAYKIGYKLIGDMYHRFEIVNTLEEAVKRMKQYEIKGWNPIIKAIH